MRICAYAVMPNHWHLLLWPECDGELAAFMQRLTITHVRRWQERGAMRDWAMSTKVDTSRSQGKGRRFWTLFFWRGWVGELAALMQRLTITHVRH